MPIERPGQMRGSRRDETLSCRSHRGEGINSLFLWDEREEKAPDGAWRPGGGDQRRDAFRNPVEQGLVRGSSCARLRAVSSRIWWLETRLHPSRICMRANCAWESLGNAEQPGSDRTPMEVLYRAGRWRRQGGCRSSRLRSSPDGGIEAGPLARDGTNPHSPPWVRRRTLSSTDSPFRGGLLQQSGVASRTDDVLDGGRSWAGTCPLNGS